MVKLSPAPTKKRVVYPESDGERMADNTLQFHWIVTIKEGLEALFADRPDVFVAGDLLWYPVEGHPKIRRAPDAMVAFGRPKGYRGAYLQWEEGGVAPQVVFEVLSPGNTVHEMLLKLSFYDQYGVEEYYLYDPERGSLKGWRREGGRLERIEGMQGWVSPRLGVRFGLEGADLLLIRPDGERFLGYVELMRDRERAKLRAELADQRAELADQRAELADQRAELEALERRRSDRRAQLLEARLRELGIALDPEPPATPPTSP